jgi:hypothetical protein
MQGDKLVAHGSANLAVRVLAEPGYGLFEAGVVGGRGCVRRNSTEEFAGEYTAVSGLLDRPGGDSELYEVGVGRERREVGKAGRGKISPGFKRVAVRGVAESGEGAREHKLVHVGGGEIVGHDGFGKAICEHTNELGVELAHRTVKGACASEGERRVRGGAGAEGERKEKERAGGQADRREREGQGRRGARGARRGRRGRGCAAAGLPRGKA